MGGKEKERKEREGNGREGGSERREEIMIDGMEREGMGEWRCAKNIQVTKDELVNCVVDRG